MFVGVLRVSLSIVGSQSLKDKRRVVASFKERVISRFRVSAAGRLDIWQRVAAATMEL